MNTLQSVAGRAGTIALQVARADAQAWGQALEATARTIAALAVFVFVAGESVGRWVHETSAVLGQLHACLLVGHKTIEKAAVQVAEAIDLAGLTVRELRSRALALGIKKAGGRRTCSATKAALLLALA